MPDNWHHICTEHARNKRFQNLFWKIEMNESSSRFSWMSCSRISDH